MPSPKAKQQKKAQARNKKGHGQEGAWVDKDIGRKGHGQARKWADVDMGR